MRKLFEDFHGEPLPAALRQQLGALVLCFVQCHLLSRSHA